MKKITQSFLAVSLSTAILFQNMVIVSNAEEIKEKNTYIDSQSSQVKDCAIQPDPETIPHRSMGETSSVYSYSNSLSNLETKGYEKTYRTTKERYRKIEALGFIFSTQKV